MNVGVEVFEEFGFGVSLDVILLVIIVVFLGDNKKMVEDLEGKNVLD